MSLWKGNGSTQSSQGTSAPAPPVKTQQKPWWYVMLFVLLSAVAKSILASGYMGTRRENA